MVMNKVLMDMLNQIELAFHNKQLTLNETNNLVREIDILLDAKELEL
jgi:hypothetical protein